MPRIPEGPVTSCSYEYRNNADGTVTEIRTTCATGCPQNPKPSK